MNAATDCAWVTLLTQPEYLPGVLALARSLRQHASRAPLVVMVTANIDADIRATVNTAGCRVVEASPPAINPELTPHYANARFAEVWTKLAVWTLTDYRQLVFLDADMLVLENMDELLDMDLPDGGRGIAACHACRCNPRHIPSYPACWRPENCYYSYCDSAEMVASGWPGGQNYLNGGLLVLRPDRQTYEAMALQLAQLDDLQGYVFAEQDFLNQFFYGRWQPLHYGYNALKTLAVQHPKLWDLARVKNLHFILDKPWVRYPRPDDEWYALHRLWWQAMTPDA